MAKAKFTQEDDELLADLGVDVDLESKSEHTPREARVIAGFEEIEAFYEKNGRLPKQGDDLDIFECIYATRLEAILKSKECLDILAGCDRHGLLANASTLTANENELIDDDALLEELGVNTIDDSSLTKLTHVKSSSEKRAAEEIGHRALCQDFAGFKDLFQTVKAEIKEGIRKTMRFKQDASIVQGEFFILNGQIAYIDKVGELTEDSYGKLDGRLRIIFDNGTESNILMRSLQKALYKDEAGRRVTNPNAGPLFEHHIDENDQESGTIYVLRSKSDHPDLKPHKNLVHKIGVTGGDVSKRILNAKLDPTFLMADVEIVATYQLYNINRTKLENLLHHFFDSARLKIQISDRFGNPIYPREWFLVPLSVVNEVVERIVDQSITKFRYDSKQAKLVSL